MNKKILIISQVIPQWYVDLLCAAFDKTDRIEFMTGSDIAAENIIKSPPHDPRSFLSRLKCWYRHYRFVKKWLRKNKKKHYDIIFAVSNPPINSFIGLKLKKRLKAKFIYMNWDLYPQVIENTIKNPLVRVICGLWHKWNDVSYPKIDKMLTIGNVMAESMKAPMKNKIDIGVIPVSVDTQRLKPIDKKENPFCVQYGLTDKFVVLYSGKMGYGHNIEIILQASERLRKRGDIIFLFIGEGPKYLQIEEFIKNSCAKNILLMPLRTEEEFPFSMASGDVGIVSQEEKAAKLFMPSKTYSMLACGMPVIGISSPDDNLSRLLKSGETGYTVSGDSAEELAGIIEKLADDTELLHNMKNSARALAVEKYDTSVVVKQYREIFGQF